MPELAFLPNEAREGEGLSDAGIETYRDNPFPAVARENGQNSRDAHDRTRCPDDPVKVEIERIEVPADTLPDHAAYLATVRTCLALAEAGGTKKERDFFSQAEKVLTRPTIPILRISDTGTRGLRGPCEEGRPFHALVKSTGISDKPDDTSGGSFGIGKSAVYAASDLQTVFYSTLYEDQPGQPLEFLCQGKTKFRSFRDDEGRHFRSIGYWGDPDGFMPVSDPGLVPEWLRREEIGTTVCSVAVREVDDWQSEIIASVVINFFSAIEAGRMEFTVDGDTINANTLRRRFDDPQIEAAADPEQFAFARDMYDCLTETHDAVQHQLDLPGVGPFRLRIMVRDGLPKRVGILRNGLLICDSLVHFRDQLRHFPMHRDFIAIVEPAADASNAWLRDMENPRHDELSPERLLEPAQRSSALGAGKMLAKMIRAEIEKVAKSARKEDNDIEELSEFFALDNEGREDEEGTRKVESFRVRPPAVRKKTRQTKPPASPQPGEEGGSAVEHGGGSSTGGSQGPGAGEKGTGTGTRAARKALPLQDPRTIADAADPHLRQIFFTPAESGTALLEFESSGLSEPASLAIEGGACRVDCVGGRRQEISVRFAEAYDGPIEIVSWHEEAADEAQ